jgi:hypothetical protein
MGQGHEIRIDLVVEQVPPEPADHLHGADQFHRVRRIIHQVIGQGREPLHVIEVQMREQDVADPPLLVQPQRRPDGAGIHHHRPVDEEPASPTLVASLRLLQELVRSMTTQNSNFHPMLPTGLAPDH